MKEQASPFLKSKLIQKEIFHERTEAKEYGIVDPGDGTQSNGVIIWRAMMIKSR